VLRVLLESAAHDAAGAVVFLAACLGVNEWYHNLESAARAEMG
jgi:hypothetical protein